MMYAKKENFENPFFSECYELIKQQIDLNLEPIDEARMDHAQGVDISTHVGELKEEFNFVTFTYRDLFKEFHDPLHQSIFSS